MRSSVENWTSSGNPCFCMWNFWFSMTAVPLLQTRQTFTYLFKRNYYGSLTFIFYTWLFFHFEGTRVCFPCYTNKVLPTASSFKRWLAVLVIEFLTRTWLSESFWVSMSHVFCVCFSCHLSTGGSKDLRKVAVCQQNAGMKKTSSKQQERPRSLTKTNWFR